MLMAVSAPTLSSLLSCHDQPKIHHVVQKCAYCMVQADLPAAPPPPAGVALALMLPQRAAPELHAPAPAAQHVRLAPHSRAPPSA